MEKVKKFLKDVFCSTIIQSLTAGNKLGMNRNQNRPVHDGSISTIVLVGCVLSMVAVVLLVHSNKAKRHYIPILTVKILLIVMVFIGLLTIIILAVLNCRNKLEISTRYRLEGKNRLKIKFLWLFGIMSNVFEGFVIGVFVECLSVATTKTVKITYYFRILYSFLLIIFHFVQIVFISYFSGSRILASVTSHYGILLLLAANGAIWSCSFIQASSTLFSLTTSAYLPNQSSYHCLGNTSSFDTFLHHAKPILYPAHVAFSLLSVGILLSMWSSTENHVTNETNISVYIELSGGDSNSSHHDREYRHRPVPTRHNPLSYYATIVIGIVFALHYILGAFLVVESNDQSLTNIWISYKLGYKIILWIFCLVAFYKLKSECKPNLCHKPLDGNESILFFSTLVDAMFHTFGLIAGALIIPNDDVIKTTANIVLVENIFNLLIDYYQTVFLIQANRFKKKSRNNLSWPIENTCLLLCILNTGQWIIDSFAGKEYHTGTMVQQQYYLPRYWDGVMSFVFPVAVYFRFQSFMGMYSLYDKFKNNN